MHAYIDIYTRRRQNLLFPAMIVGNLVSPLQFCRVWQSKVLVSVFCESPIVFHGLVQSGIWHDHFKTTIMNANFEQYSNRSWNRPSWEFWEFGCFILIPPWKFHEIWQIYIYNLETYGIKRYDLCETKAQIVSFGWQWDLLPVAKNQLRSTSHFSTSRPLTLRQKMISERGTVKVEVVRRSKVKGQNVWSLGVAEEALPLNQWSHDEWNNDRMPRPSKGIKFLPPGLFLVVKGHKFHTKGFSCRNLCQDSKHWNLHHPTSRFFNSGNFTPSDGDGNTTHLLCLTMQFFQVLHWLNIRTLVATEKPAFLMRFGKRYIWYM